MGVPIMLAVVGLLSLVDAQHLLAVDPSASLYLLPPRAWELLLGAAVAQPLIRELRIPARLIRVLNYVAIFALLLPIVFYSDATPFPGLAAVPCCLGTAWLLWSGRCGTITLVQTGLSARIPVAVGRISYSLYLWHWPIYVFIAYYEAGEIGWVARAVALSLTFVLAVLSWRFVEQPIRYARRSPFVVFVGAFIGSCVLAGWAGHHLAFRWGTQSTVRTDRRHRIRCRRFLQAGRSMLAGWRPRFASCELLQ